MSPDRLLILVPRRERQHGCFPGDSDLWRLPEKLVDARFVARFSGETEHGLVDQEQEVAALAGETVDGFDMVPQGGLCPLHGCLDERSGTLGNRSAKSLPLWREEQAGGDMPND